jgi:hypothetical protein
MQGFVTQRACLKSNARELSGRVDKWNDGTTSRCRIVIDYPEIKLDED